LRKGDLDERYFYGVDRIGSDAAPADDRREINSQYVHSDPMIEAKRKLADALLDRRTTLLFALAGNDLAKAETENDLRGKP
jgi:hypothetical protein